MVVGCARLAVCAPLLLGLLGVCQGRQFSADCPSYNIIHPCRCSATMLGLRVLCAGVANEQTLRNLLGYLSNYRMNALTLQHINFTVTPDLFSRLQAVTIKITESQFRMQDTRRPGRSPVASRVEDLDVRQSTLDLGNSNLAVMQGLRRVVVDASNISILKKSWFDGLSRLTLFAIENTQLGGLEDRALAGLNEVHSISLTADGLKYLRRSYFPTFAARLMDLDFRAHSAGTGRKRLIVGTGLSATQGRVFVEYTPAPRYRPSRMGTQCEHVSLIR
ncbi:uncharacterized protein LOC144104148 isoform X6 [Amblyomma americanum]